MCNSFRRLIGRGRTLITIGFLLFLAAPAHAGFLGLAWNANSETDLAGYILCYGPVSGSCTTEINVGKTTTWSSTTLTDGQLYYFAVLAYNSDGTRSSRSVELSTMPFTPAKMISPLSGASLTSGSTAFQWGGGNGASSYRLSVGSTPGAVNIFDQTLAGTSVTVTGLPTTGAISARLWSMIGTTWYFTDYTYTAARPTLSISGVSVPEGNSGTQTANFTVTLTPTASAPVTVRYATANGTATAGTDYTAASGTLTIAAGVSTGTIGVTITGDTTVETDETFTMTLSAASANAAIATAQATGTIRNDEAQASTAQITFPADGASGADLSQGIRWTTVPSVQAYYLYVGSTVGGKDLVNTGEIQQTSYMATGLPAGQTVFARIYTKVAGVWRFADSRFSATSITGAVLTAPTNGAVNVDPTKPIQWTAVTGVQAYYLYVGSTLGAKDLVNTGEIQKTSYTATTLPAGRLVFARIYTKLGGAWRSADTSFTVGGTTTSYLSDRPWKSMTNGYGPVEIDRSNGESAAGDGMTLTLNGVTYAKGLGTHAPSDIRYALNGACSVMTAAIGLDDQVGVGGGVTFQVWTDGVKKYDSGVMTGATATKTISVPVTGATELALLVLDGGNTYDDLADWADAKISCKTAATGQAMTTTSPATDGAPNADPTFPGR